HTRWPRDWSSDVCSSDLQPGDQRRALQECFLHHRNASAVLKDKRVEAVTVRELRGWVAREIHLDLTNAPFDLQDEKLLPAAGARSEERRVGKEWRRGRGE